MAAHAVPNPVGLHAFYPVPFRKVCQRVLHGLWERKENGEVETTDCLRQSEWLGARWGGRTGDTEAQEFTLFPFTGQSEGPSKGYTDGPIMTQLHEMGFTHFSILSEPKFQRKKKINKKRMRWLDSVNDFMDMNLSKLREILKDREAWRVAVHGVAKSQTPLNNWTTTCLSLMEGVGAFSSPV